MIEDEGRASVRSVITVELDQLATRQLVLTREVIEAELSRVNGRPVQVVKINDETYRVLSCEPITIDVMFSTDPETAK